MGVTVAWHDAHCIRYEFDGVWDWGQLDEAYRQARAMERASGRKADVIINMQQGDCSGLADCGYVTGNTFIYALLQKQRAITKRDRAGSVRAPQPVLPTGHPR